MFYDRVLGFGAQYLLGIDRLTGNLLSSVQGVCTPPGLKSLGELLPVNVSVLTRRTSRIRMLKFG